MRTRLTMLLAMAVVLAMLLANAGMASAVALSNGKGGDKANDRAVFGIYTAVYNTQKHDPCSIC